MINKDKFKEDFKDQLEEIQIGNKNSLIFACGKNENFELSLKGYSHLNKPVGINFPNKYIITNISSSGDHSSLITEEGDLFMFGSNISQKLGLIAKQNSNNISKPTLFQKLSDDPIIQVVCGDYHTLCLLENGKICIWGGTLHNKLGKNSQEPSFLTSLDKQIISKIGCGDFHSVALSDNGILFTWGGGKGYNNKGQCGHGNENPTSSPKPVEFFKEKPVLDFDCGNCNTIALTEREGVFSWGSGLSGELGIGEVF